MLYPYGAGDAARNAAYRVEAATPYPRTRPLLAAQPAWERPYARWNRADIPASRHAKLPVAVPERTPYTGNAGLRLLITAGMRG